ncbi:MAG: THxN family PEP-CTERM protein [Azoarcus sp.]|nr:THxN family PEP-CTERM protein [Azoarcus sp.]
MPGTVRKFAALSIVAFAASTAYAASAPTDWNYTFDLTWVAGSASFTPGTRYTGDPGIGQSTQTDSVLSWGSILGNDTRISFNSDLARSSLIIDPTVASTVTSNGDTQYVNAFTHVNNALSASFSTLNHAQMALNVTLEAADGSGFTYSWTQVFDVYFKEVPNLTGNSIRDGDIFVITWNPDSNVSGVPSYGETFSYDGYEYAFNYFESTQHLTELSLDQCQAVGQAGGCVGLMTDEYSTTPVQFAFSVSTSASTPTSTTPVPEPETYAMLLAGLGIVGVVARRRRHYIHG